MTYRGLLVERVAQKAKPFGSNKARHAKGSKSAESRIPFNVAYTLIQGDESIAETTPVSAPMPDEMAYDIKDYAFGVRAPAADHSFFEQVVETLCQGKICVEAGCGSVAYFEYAEDAGKLVEYYTAQ